jgi:hypothetical protein
LPSNVKRRILPSGWSDPGRWAPAVANREEQTGRRARRRSGLPGRPCPWASGATASKFVRLAEVAVVPAGGLARCRHSHPADIGEIDTWFARNGLRVDAKHTVLAPTDWRRIAHWHLCPCWHLRHTARPSAGSACVTAEGQTPGQFKSADRGHGEGRAGFWALFAH